MRLSHFRLSAAALVLAAAGLFAWSADAEAQTRSYCQSPLSAGGIKSFGAASPERGCSRGTPFRSNRTANETRVCLYCDPTFTLVFLADVQGGTYASCMRCEPGCSLVTEGGILGGGQSIVAKCAR